MGLQGGLVGGLEELLEAAGQAVLAPLGVGQAAGAQLLGLFLVAVQDLAAEATGHLAGEEEGPDPALAAALGGRPEQVEAAGGEQVGDILDHQGAAQVRLVRAIALHGVPVGEAGEGRLDRAACQGGELLHEGLDDALDVLLAHEAHLHVHLGELGLAVGAQVLVPEAAADLDVALEATHLEQLLEELGALGQGEELTRMNPAGHQVVPGPLGCGLGEDGGLELDEPLLPEVIPDEVRGLAAEHHVPLELVAAQVQEAMGQAQILPHILVIQGEGQGRGGVEDAQLREPDFHIARGQVGVLALALGHHALDGQHELAAHGL